MMKESFKTNGKAHQLPSLPDFPENNAGRLPPLQPKLESRGAGKDIQITLAPIKSDDSQSLWVDTFAAVLPHEWIFGTYLLITGLRLFAHGGAAERWSFLFLGILLAGICVFFWAERKPTPGRLRLRLLFYPAAMGLSFFSMGQAIPLLGIPPVDGLLLQWDRDLLGETPAITWEPWLRPWLEDVAMGGYLFFFYYLIAGPGHYCIRNLRLFRKCIVGLFTMYGLAFAGYTVLPAGGPHIYLTFKTPLHGPWLLDRTINTVNAASNGLDVFPSVHFAASLYLLLFDWRHWRKRFWWVLLPCIVLWFSTMYLRFHYFVDVLAAAVLALASWFMAEAYDASRQISPREFEMDDQDAGRRREAVVTEP
ncbi:MAG TPA: phosphatase PAP2 family protein [Verrucomicrobiae bacterium]|nr:phosphatase PAP2 family protein [Verrucomicrobiae bacterium]